MSYPVKSVPLVAAGHTRPVTHLSFSLQEEDGTYLLASSCKDGNPMLRDWKGDWIGTFIGHKGAVWCTKLSLDNCRAASGSADFTAYDISTLPLFVLFFHHSHFMCLFFISTENSGTRIRANLFIRSLTIISFAVSPCRQKRIFFLREGKKRKPGYLISDVQMLLQIFWAAIRTRLAMRARSRACYGSVRISG